MNISVQYENFKQASAALEELFEGTRWDDQYVSSLKVILRDMGAVVLGNNQMYTENALRESFIQHARRASSVYAALRFLGVRVVRRQPSATSVRMFNISEDTIYIDPYTAITIGSKSFYVKESLKFEPKGEATFDAFEGLVVYEDLTMGDVVSLGSTGFVISDDIVLTIDNESWTPHIGSMLDLTPFDRKFFDVTRSDGGVDIVFGDGENGMRPEQGTQIKSRYVITSGALADGILAGETARFADTRLEGSTLSEVSGGESLKDISYYRRYAPMAYQSKGLLFNPSSWKANIMLYPGVADCTILSQRDLAPGDFTYMNVVQICILPKDQETWGGGSGLNPNSAKWREFLVWARERCNRLSLLTLNPQKISTDIHLAIRLRDTIRVEDYKQIIDGRISVLFKRRAGVLGRKLSRSDIYDAVAYSLQSDGSLLRDENIDYIEILKPTADVSPSNELQYVQPKNITIELTHSERRY